MKKAVRGALIAVVCVAGVAVVLVGAWLVLTRMSFPRVRGTAHLQGISAPVTIQRDAYGVPHIYARTSRDLFFAEGYVHAQDRFWQMEFCRRIGDGRLSELFGKSQLQTDIFLRTLGIARVAKKEYEQADPKTRGILDAYAAGVNAYIGTRRPARLGLEFAVLNLTGVKTKIEPWSPVNTLAWAKMMAWSLDDSWEGEVLVSRLLHTLGTGGLPKLITPYRPEMPFTVSDAELQVASSQGGAPLALLAPQVAAARGSVPLALFGAERAAGSNAWAVAGRRTASGKPILANDMHLDGQIPSIWYEIGLHGIDESGHVGRTPECPFDLYGYSLAGVPGIVSGHNDKIAWGLTSLYGDTQDLYLERINPANPDQYLVDGKWETMISIYEEIPVRKAKEPYRLRVRMTRHGPLISDHGSRVALQTFAARTGTVFPENADLTAVALRWTALEPSSVVGASLLLDQAQSYDEFRTALRGWKTPTLNVVYVDIDGNIAYQCVGRMPIRAKGSGEAPIPGWDSSFEWTDYIPFDELPRSLNPTKGYIVTANNPPAGTGYHHLISKEFDYGYRARRIVELIESAKQPIGVKEIQAMQADTLNYEALEIRDAFKGLDLHPTALERHIMEEKTKDLTARQKKAFEKREAEALSRMEDARDLLLRWDGRMTGKSAAAALYGYVWLQLVAETFRDQYPESAWPMTASTRAENAMHYLLEDRNSAVWDDLTTPARETRDEILVRSFRRGYANLVEDQGKNPKRWRWDKSHTITFVNPSLGKSGIGPVEKIFNRGPYPIDSGPSEVNQEAWDPKKPFEVTHYPSMRLIIDMGDIAGAVSVIPTGESGHPGNRHYDDFIELWRKVEYHPALWNPEAIRRSGGGKLMLLPKRDR